MNCWATGEGNDWAPAALPQVIPIFIMNVNGWGCAAAFDRVNTEKWVFLLRFYYNGASDIKIKYKCAHKAEQVKVHECNIFFISTIVKRNIKTHNGFGPLLFK